MTIKSIWLRKIHKWVGLVIGLQFLLWAISGAGMALLDMDQVSGGPKADQAAPAPLTAGSGWPLVQRALRDQPVHSVTIRRLPSGPAYEVSTASGMQLFDLDSGRPIAIDRHAAAAIARSAHPEAAAVRSVRSLEKVELAVRDHALPIWRIDFADDSASSYYVSGASGELLERRNDSWRLWDILWMLHIMDYSDRSSFNHPLIITVGVAMGWLAITGFWLLFRTMWRHDFAFLRRPRAPR